MAQPRLHPLARVSYTSRAMINDPFPVCLTFDVDAEAGLIGRDAANAWEL